MASDQQFIDYINSGEVIFSGSEMHKKMGQLTLRAQEITSKLNNEVTDIKTRRLIFNELTNNQVGDNFGIAPPFSSDCGLNLHIGDNVYINAACNFQDQGGIYIGNNVLIGHNSVILSLDHQLEPENRRNTYANKVVLEDYAWIGANVTILPGVRVGYGAIVAAGAVVSKDVVANTLVAGVPAKKIRDL